MLSGKLPLSMECGCEKTELITLYLLKNNKARPIPYSLRLFDWWPFGIHTCYWMFVFTDLLGEAF